jgi:hypothetical protein
MLTIEDKIAIQELIARFAHCSDYADWAELEKLYAPDVVTEMEGIPMSYTGIAEQIEHAKESDRRAAGKNRHYNFNLYVEEENGQVFFHERQCRRRTDGSTNRRHRPHERHRGKNRRWLEDRAPLRSLRSIVRTEFLMSLALQTK